jgi:hypothetical protein
VYFELRDYPAMQKFHLLIDLKSFLLCFQRPAFTLVLFQSWLFYLLYSLTEMTLTLLIVWYAWKWPRRVAS